MTREEAIAYWKQRSEIIHKWIEENEYVGFFCEYVEAIDMAIEALSEQPKGEWIHDTHYGVNLPEHKCSICGEWEYSDEESNVCPNCHADMKGGDGE